MPHNRNSRFVPGLLPPQQGGFEAFAPHEEGFTPSVSHCCVPGGCSRHPSEVIQPSNPGDAVKVVCNNSDCSEGQWMHSECFSQWEASVLSYLRTCGRARSWSEKQRYQNLWTKKGYDLAFKACDCNCRRGHLRKDLLYIPTAPSNQPGSPGDGGANKRRRHKSKPGNQGLAPSNQWAGINMMKQQQQQLLQQMGLHMQQQQQQQQQQQHHQIGPQLRVRTSSFGSTGSMSPPSSAGTPPLTPNSTSGSGGAVKKSSKFDFFSTPTQAATGNIFRRRRDFSVFRCLPRHQQNPYHIKMEDEGPHGNDETRCFVLTNLSTHQVTEVSCVVCSQSLPVYDQYPLIDGTFFLSPQRYNTNLQVLSDSKMLYLNAVCMRCQESPPGCNNLRCLACRQPWFGSAFMIGSMYSYDIFAALPCCAHRLRCKNCSRPIMDPSSAGFNFFSEYSKPIVCPHCQAEDYHCIRPLEDSFTYKGPIRA